MKNNNKTISSTYFIEYNFYSETKDKIKSIIVRE